MAYGICRGADIFLVDIYCCNLLYKTWRFLTHEDSQSDVRVVVYQYSRFGVVYAIYIRRGLSVLLIREWVAKTLYGVS